MTEKQKFIIEKLYSQYNDAVNLSNKVSFFILPAILTGVTVWVKSDDYTQTLLVFIYSFFSILFLTFGILNLVQRINLKNELQKYEVGREIMIKTSKLEWAIMIIGESSIAAFTIWYLAHYGF